ncbi:uncharacterized protein LOC105645799 isoform X2 [Jatropha curcas]|uniref:uncharacterized protein LOC105645799 isoform X2 n=1 Tax=Jatropha curcas TaxID=180498 RepID=UPI0005FBEAC3|nr:uncharacterized protein LOC105645799 isoform X2 [Jatropha curcas]
MDRRSPNSNMLKTSLSKNSVPRSPMPKSPLPRSPVPKSPEFYEKYKSRCAYSLMSFFHFRQRRSKKLISDTDKRCLKRHALGDEYIKNKLDYRNNDGANKKSAMVDSGYGRVKKITGEDVSIEQEIKKKITTAKVENVQSDSELVDDRSRNHRKAPKSQRSRRLPIYGCYDVSTVDHGEIPHQNLAGSDRSSKSIDSVVSAEVQVHTNENCMHHERPNEINLQVNMNEATEAFINQKLIDGKHLIADGASHQSKNFLDALKILNSNKDLFIKLLQDPNSLLVKHIEDLRDSQTKKLQNKSFARGGLSECQTRNTRKCNLLMETGDFQPLEKIVVFRPSSKSLQNHADRTSNDSPQIHYSLRSVHQSVKPIRFPFKQMKRTLMHAIGVSRKEQQLLTDNLLHDKSVHGFEGGQCSKEAVAGSIKGLSPNEASSDFERMTKSSMDVNRKDQRDKLGQFDSVVRDEVASASESSHENSHLSTIRHPKRNEHFVNIETEFKNENANLPKKQKVKSYDVISSLLEYDLFPEVSRRTRKPEVVSQQMRFSSYYSRHTVNEDNWRSQEEKENSCSSPVRQNVEAVCGTQMQKHEMRRKISSNPFPDDKEQQSISSLNNDMSHIEKTCGEKSEEIAPSELPSDPDSSLNNCVNQSIKTVDGCEENGSLNFSREDSPVKNQTSTSSIDDYSSSPLNNQRFGAFDMIKQNTEQTSPVSVLDKLFAEDVNSPSNTKSHPALPLVPLLQIGSEEGYLATAQKSPLSLNSNISTEEYKSMLEYASTLLQTSRLSWDELTNKCHFSDQLLDQSLFSEINVRSNESCDNNKLLFDYVNEVLLDACMCYSKCSPWLPFLKPRILSATMTGNIVNEVMAYFDWNLLLAAPLKTLEQITEKDLMKSRTWMNNPIDAEEAVGEMVDSLMEELIIDFAID